MGRGKSVIEFGTSKIACLTDLNERFSQSVIAGHSCARYEGIKDGTWVNKRGVLKRWRLRLRTANSRAESRFLKR